MEQIKIWNKDKQWTSPSLSVYFVGRSNVHSSKLAAVDLLYPNSLMLLPEEVDFQSLTVTAKDFVKKSQSKPLQNWIIFLFLTDAFSLISEITFIQIIDPPDTMLSTVIQILRATKILPGIKRTPLVTCRELGICMILILIALCKSFVFTRLCSLFIQFCISLLYLLHI